VEREVLSFWRSLARVFPLMLRGSVADFIENRISDIRLSSSALCWLQPAHLQLS
jgi:hypothetical protein